MEENVADALKMAGSVLLFVMALSICIMSFGQAKNALDTILAMEDRETVYIDGDYYYKGTEKLTRTVGLETIIPSIYRAYEENYRIVFDGVELYRKNSEPDKSINYIDLIDETIGNDQARKRFIKGILYRDFSDYEANSQTKFEEEFSIRLIGDKSLYSLLVNKDIEEKLGTFYLQDVSTEEEDGTGSSQTPESNKTTKRVITYIVK